VLCDGRALLREDGELVSWVERFVVDGCGVGGALRGYSTAAADDDLDEGAWSTGQLAEGEGEGEGDCAWVARVISLI
jgi:hypothetical protein